MLSGERNFAVRLNKKYEAKLRMDIPPFSGNYGDLLVLVGIPPHLSLPLVFLKKILMEPCGLCLQVIHALLVGTNARLAPLYDCLLTIVVNGRLEGCFCGGVPDSISFRWACVPVGTCWLTGSVASVLG